jgi:1-acyl-sn-glycerol-3-phosphate acyltransferase
VLERCTVISKKEVLYFGTFGLASWLWGTIFIDRVKKEEAQQTVNSTAKIIQERKANNHAFIIYIFSKCFLNKAITLFKTVF